MPQQGNPAEGDTAQDGKSGDQDGPADYGRESGDDGGNDHDASQGVGARPGDYGNGSATGSGVGQEGHQGPPGKSSRAHPLGDGSASTAPSLRPSVEAPPSADASEH